jgi:hypothetical protein
MKEGRAGHCVYFVGLVLMYSQLLFCLDWHLCAMHARHSVCKVEG